MKIRIATRKSALAMWQAEYVARELRQLPEVENVSLLPMTTRGDEVLDRSLQDIGGKGLFIKELELAMQDDAADIAVHSMKDVPAEMPEGFCIAAVLPRAAPYDALLSRGGKCFADLPQAARIGSSSLRRQAQLRALRSDVQVFPLRGNVNTRLAKLAAGDYDAIVLACAGLERLGLDEQISERFDPEQMLPAAAQGVIGVECLADRDGLRQVLAQLEHSETRCTTVAERAVARRLQASCQSPVASFATLHGDDLTLLALVASVDGSTLLREEITGSSAEAEALGIEAANRLLARGAASLLGADSA
ncbi:MAG: hydroxymethylbilane synthase [Woeseiaceae bacterium]